MTIDRKHTRLRARVAVGTAGLAAVVYYGRARLLRWGATDEEVARTLPGDNLIVAPNIASTRAITVCRRPDEVWPWIAQLGQGRGGFYSYDSLENLLGFDIHSADRIDSEWQQIQVGDEVHLAAAVALKVVLVEPDHALVLQGCVPIGSAPPDDSTWAFVLCEASDGTTRLLSRERYGYKRWWARLIIEPTALMSFVMSRKMLRGIRDRAEHEDLSSLPDEHIQQKELHGVGTQ
jgi:hypothetical protein